MMMRPSRPRLAAKVASILLAFPLALVTAGCATSAPARQVSVTAAGDYGAQPAAAGVLDLIGEQQPDVHLALGDLSYGQLTPESAWCDFVTEHAGNDVPFELLAGNHETPAEPGSDIAQFARCLPNRMEPMTGDYPRQYFLDLPASDPVVRLIQTSPNLTFEDGLWEYRAGDAHYQWLSDAIDQAHAEGINWVVVSAHKPCQSIGVHTCAEVSDFYDLLVAKRVDLALFGHEHSYMRTHQLATDPQSCPVLPVDAFDPECMADTDSSFQAGAGTVFATVGTGGAEIRESNLSDPEAGFFASESGSNTDPAHGVLALTITDDALKAEFLPTDGATFTDRFSITR